MQKKSSRNQTMLIALLVITWLVLLILSRVERPINAHPSFAPTKLLLHEASSAVGLKRSIAGAGVGCANGNQDWTFRLADTTQGTSSITRTFAPTATAPPCLHQNLTSSGQFLQWFSPPLSSGVTIAGNIDYSVYGSESATAMNCGSRFVLYRWDAITGGIRETLMTSADTTEWGSTNTQRTIAAAAPTSTVFNVGDRILITLEVRNVGGAWGGNSSRTVSILYDGAAAATGDTFANFADTLSFSSDTNNWPAQGSVSFWRNYDKETFILGNLFLGFWKQLLA